MNKLSELKEKKLDNKGFSLVELIIVIAIMAVLIGVLAPTYLRYVEKSRQSADLDTLDNIVTAVDTWAADPEGKVEDSDSISFSEGEYSTASDNIINACKAVGIDVTQASLKSTLYKDATITWNYTDANGWTLKVEPSSLQTALGHATASGS